MRYSISLLIIVFVVCSAVSSWGQCNTRFSYSVEEDRTKVEDPDKKDFSISMKLEEGMGEYSIELFDLFSSEVVDKKNLNFNISESRKVFINVKASRYLIYIENANCKKKSITTSKEGIEIK